MTDLLDIPGSEKSIGSHPSEIVAQADKSMKGARYAQH